MKGWVRINNERAIESFVNVAFQRDGVAMIEVATEWLGVEFIGEFLARLNQAGAGYPVHARGVDAVEMYGMRVAAAIDESDSEPLAFGTPERWSRHTAVEEPAREFHAGRHFKLLVDGCYDPFPDLASVVSQTHRPGVPVGQYEVWIKSVRGVIDFSDNIVSSGSVSVMAGLSSCGSCQWRYSQRSQKPTPSEIRQAHGSIILRQEI